MSKLIDTYRRDHTRQQAPRPKKWPLAVACLGGLIAIGAIMLRAGLFQSTPDTGVTATIQEPVTVLRPGVSAQMDANDANVTGSTTPMTALQPSPAANVGWTSLLYVIGVSGLTGLIVFVGLSLVIRKRARSDADKPGGRSQTVRRLDDDADERRWHGGPIRN